MPRFGPVATSREAQPRAHFFSCSWRVLRCARSGSSNWILSLARCGSGNQIHLPMSLHKLCALHICMSFSSCHPKTNTLLATSLCLLLYLSDGSQESFFKLEVRLFDPKSRSRHRTEASVPRSLFIVTVLVTGPIFFGWDRNPVTRLIRFGSDRDFWLCFKRSRCWRNIFYKELQLRVCEVNFYGWLWVTQ